MYDDEVYDDNFYEDDTYDEGMYEDDNIYEGYSENSEAKEIKGITDTVTDYTYTGLTYPCIIFKRGIKLEKHKVQVISNMVKSSTTGLLKDISLYFDNDELYKLGMISGVQVSPLIEIVGVENLVAFVDENTKLDASLIYTLCTV